jgi:hypothetical protein
MADKQIETQASGQTDLEGKYANYFQVGHNAFEFVVDFGQMYSDGPREQIHTRIVTGPWYAKEFMELLEQSVEQYEEHFGPITRDR